MQHQNQKKWIAQRDKLITELQQLSQLIHGTWVERYTTCSRPQCSCHQGKRHGPRAYVIINEKGKQRQKYVPNNQKTAVQNGIKQYKRLLDIADRISQINLLLMRNKSLDLGNETENETANRP